MVVDLRLPPKERSLLTEDEWAEVAIVSAVRFVDVGDARFVAEATVGPAPGEKCARCWRVLPEVGENPRHPALCRRCADAVESGLVRRTAAE